MLTGLVYGHERQTSLFGNSDDAKSDKLMSLMDSLNGRYGRETVRLASCGSNRSWAMSRQYLSPAYTTRLADLASVK